MLRALFPGLPGKMLWSSLAAIGTILLASLVYGSVLSVVEHKVTDGTGSETTPTIGNDGLSDLVVYTAKPVIGSGFGPADIWYQRLADGAPTGPAWQITFDATDDQLNDVSGDYVVYTAFESTSSTRGIIILYRISTKEFRPLGYAEVMQEPRIHGSYVVWVQGPWTAQQVMLYDLAWLGTVHAPVLLAGPVPSANLPQVGERYAVWSEYRNGQYDVAACDLQTLDPGDLSCDRIQVTSSADLNEYDPATSGEWVVWEEFGKTASPSRIVAKNLLTNELRVVADNGALNERPSISGDLIVWESNLPGNLDVYVYRLSTAETFQVTTNLNNQYLNDVWQIDSRSGLVAYVDMRDGDEDVFVAKLFFNSPPVANAGTDQTVARGTSVTLDGSGSSDPDGDTLTYEWAFVSKPVGSTAVLSDPAVVNPSFTADMPGDYVIGLVVTDSHGLASEVNTVTISTTNTKPVAEAGPDQQLVAIGTTVQLDGTQSWDPDGDTLTYQWSFESKPVGSTAMLSNPTAAKPTFIADVRGEYRVQLVVSDPWVASDPDTVIISFNNVAPVAYAGGNQSVTEGDTVFLNGSGTDANGDTLTFLWSLVSKPAGSGAVLSSTDTAATSFVADVAGTYVASLVVNDGTVNSEPSNATITATSSSSQVIQTLKDAVDAINALACSNLKNCNNKNALTNKINAVLMDIDQGRYREALDKLLNDILKKTDGCATAGAPDKNDWIKDCAAQAQVYPLIMEAILLLGG